MTAGSPGSRPRLVIEPAGRLAPLRLRDLWEYRDLALILVRRDVTLRYRQSAIGALWAILQPVGLAAVFSVFLGLLAKVPSSGSLPYPLYAFSGMVMWQFFTNALQRTSESTVNAASIISKVWFPRLIIPLSAPITPLLDFALGFVVLVVAMLAYGYVPAIGVLLLPVVVALALVVAEGAGLWLSAVNVRYRDVAQLLPFLTLVGLFVTPIVYPFGLVPSYLRPVYALNPMVGVLEVYRWCLFGHMTAAWWIVLIPLATALLLFFSGLIYFRRAELTFADVI